MTCDYMEYIFARDFVTYVMKNSKNFDPSRFAYYKNETSLFSDNHRRTLDRLLAKGLSYFYRLVDLFQLGVDISLENLHYAGLQLGRKLLFMVENAYPNADFSGFFKTCYMLSMYSFLIIEAGLSDVSRISVAYISGIFFRLNQVNALGPNVARDFPNAVLNC